MMPFQHLRGKYSLGVTNPSENAPKQVMNRFYLTKWLNVKLLFVLLCVIQLKPVSGGIFLHRSMTLVLLYPFMCFNIFPACHKPTSTKQLTALLDLKKVCQNRKILKYAGQRVLQGWETVLYNYLEILGCPSEKILNDITLMQSPRTELLLIQRVPLRAKNLIYSTNP